VIILGIDPGSINCGYGLIEIEGRKIIAAGADAIKTKSSEPLHKRIVIIYNEICKVIEEYKPSYVAIETIFFGKNIQSALTLAHARGVLLLAASQNNIPIHEYSPREIKKSVTGNGNSAKHQVRYMVEQMLKLKEIPKSEDAIDGLAIAMCHYNKIKFDVK
jgi:crossover junction endodeoxyribonuclease RuvC